ncbi:MAG TPA: NAD-dependent epimerase/dehydratase family protein [Acidimicrobiales bacterium]|jgi:UDP-glucose 4-epimerase|nr:NAD-dependent epimerase/dehydratase family protein [Acidimicrobiales bacterium]
MLLVTGGAGFIGAQLVAAALAAGHTVRVLDDLSTGDKRAVPDTAELIEGDVSDPDAVAHALDGVSAVAHLAAHRAVPRSLVDPLATDRANTAGTLTVLEQARRAGTVERVVIASSSSVYGSAAALPTPEDTPPQPRSPYAVSKLAAEHYARVYAELHGLSTLSLRLFNVYGPGQPAAGPYAQLVPRALHDDILTIDGDGTHSRDLVYVADVAEAFLRALAASTHGVLNVGTGQAATVNEVVALAAKARGRPLDVVHGPARPADVPHTCADVSRAGHQLGWRARVGLEEGLALTAQAASAR